MLGVCWQRHYGEEPSGKQCSSGRRGWAPASRGYGEEPSGINCWQGREQHREESYLTNGVQLLLLCCIFAGKRQGLQSLEILECAEEPAVSGKTAESRSTCSAWRYWCAQKCLQRLESCGGAKSLWQGARAHLFCVQQMNLEWEE